MQFTKTGFFMLLSADVGTCLRYGTASGETKEEMELAQHLF